jgi:hypothetical protein
MSFLAGVGLPKIDVLGSTISLPGRRRPRSAGRALPEREPNLFLSMAECYSAGCAGGALYDAAGDPAHEEAKFGACGEHLGGPPRST